MSRHSLLFAAVLLTATHACAPRHGNFARGTGSNSTQKGKIAKVADTDFARIPQANLAPVEAARNDVRKAQDAALRVEQKVSMNDRQIEVARGRLTVRKAEADLAKSQLDLAKQSGDRDRIAKAQLASDRAEAGIQLETAEADLIGRQRDRVAAESTLAKKAEAVAEAKLEVARLDALRASGDASADNYDHARFEQQLAAAQSDMRRSEEDLRDDSLLRQAQVRVDQAKQALDRAGSDVRPVRGTDRPESDVPQD